MKAKLLAAMPAVFVMSAVFAVGLLLYSVSGFSASGVNAGPGKADLITTEDFLEYSSLNDVNIHELYFSVVLYEGTGSCLMCHEDEAMQMLDTGHFKWAGEVENIVGMEGAIVGKNDLLNNFCIAVPSNEPRCTQCHAGTGYANKDYDFQDPQNVDCLVCHDQSGTYAKGMKTAGMPEPDIDLNVVAQSISLGSEPTRKNCIGCHAKAGGGDNVKHGDLSTDLIATTREFDVHMGVDGANLVCTDCHGANHDPKSGAVNHGNAGMSLHSVNEGEMKTCTDCHGGRKGIHAGTAMQAMMDDERHDRLACQVCHIPAIARAKPTKVEWYWSDAGQDVSPIPIDPLTNMPTYDKKKGTFVWASNYRPVLRYSNGMWERKVIGVNDSYDQEPIQMATPQGNFYDPDAMIYPFKMMVGNQPVDSVNKTILVPHLFGMGSGPNPYWGKWDWNKALAEGAAYAGQEYSGSYSFAETNMLLSVNHEVAPAEMALGSGGLQSMGCMDCHSGDAVDWQALGWTGNPMTGGERVPAIGVPLEISTVDLSNK